MSISGKSAIVDALDRLYDILNGMPIDRKAFAYDNMIAQNFSRLVQECHWGSCTIEFGSGGEIVWEDTNRIKNQVAAVEARFLEMQKLGAFNRWFGKSQTEASLSSAIGYCKKRIGEQKLIKNEHNPYRWQICVAPFSNRAMSDLLRRRLEGINK